MHTLAVSFFLYTPLLAISVAGLWAIAQVAIGLGFVIFVHELGHFAVAKMCGVRCDKFMIGFDIGGYKLSRQWGETEYGIGILPLGGYVKMFGQEDNVANIEEEIKQSEAMANSPDAKEIVGPNGEKRWVHRRSYMAKSVPQRMAIISAGVIMNVIFAFLFAWVAFGIGVPSRPCVLGNATPGAPAWRAGLMPGDKITRLEEIDNPTYKQLAERVALGDPEADLTMVLQRTDGKTETLTLKPDTGGILPRIGFSPSVSVRLADKDPVKPNMPAAEASAAGEGFEGGDQIIAVDGEPVTAYHELTALLVARKAQPITYTVLRGGKTTVSNPFGPVTGGEEVEITVGPNPMERLGIVPQLGPIVAIQAESPAEAAGLQVGDQITHVNGIALGAAPDGEEIADPVTLDDRLAAMAQRGESAQLTVVRGDATLEVELEPLPTAWPSFASNSDLPVAYATIGVACHLLSNIEAVVSGSPAALVDIKAGDQIVKATLQSTKESDGLAKNGNSNAIPLAPMEGKKNRDWPVVLRRIQNKSPDFEVELTVARLGKEHTVTLSPAASDDFSFARGIGLRELKELRTATSLGEGAQLAWDETKASLTQIFQVLSKLGSQIPASMLGGPVTIARVAGNAASEGLGALLMSLTMLSANLAVLNFLPIPVLDGGHMVFLAWEGLTGKPANERVVIGLHLVGFLLLISLMLFVTWNDVMRLLGWF